MNRQQFISEMAATLDLPAYSAIELRDRIQKRAGASFKVYENGGNPSFRYWVLPGNVMVDESDVLGHYRERETLHRRKHAQPAVNVPGTHQAAGEPR